MKAYKKSLLHDYRDVTLREKIEFRGREYTKPGRYWAVTHVAALLNPDERLLALQSFTGSRTGEPPAQLKKEGTIFIEVYATDTGKSLCRVRGDHDYTFGADLLQRSFWLGNHYLIASISPDDMQRFPFLRFQAKDTPMTRRVGIQLPTALAALVLGFWDDGLAQSSVEVRTPLMALDTNSVQIPAGTATVFADMTLDPVSGGGENTLDVIVSHAALVVTLIPPNNVEVNAANAVSLGYGWNTHTPASAGTVVSPYLVPLPHTLIKLPSSAPPGLYRVKITNPNPAVAGEASVMYDSSSTLRAALTTREPNYRTGQSVTLTAVCLRDATPVTGATANANLRAFVDISAQASVQNLTLVSSVAVDATTVSETYTGNIVNSGSAQTRVLATVRNPVNGPVILEGTLSFGDVAANGSKPAMNTITIRRKSSVPFNPASLVWQVESDRDMGQAVFTGGQNGVYTASYVPTTPGTYTALLKITGTSNATAFSRSSQTSFLVTGPTASFISFQDQAIDDNGNGLTDRVVTTAYLNVTTPGLYHFFVHLKASNGKTLQGRTKSTLAAGGGQISVTFDAKEFLTELGVGGPYERTGVLLLYKSPGGAEATADSRASAGNTAAWTLASFDRGAAFLTGQNSAVGVVTGGGSLFDVLRVTMGVSTAQGGFCHWSASLADANGTIDRADGRGMLTAGNTSVVLDFRGPKIAKSGRNGPYQVTSVWLLCGGTSIGSAKLMDTPAYTAVQFRAAASDFTLAASPFAVSMAAGTTSYFDAHASAAVPYVDAITGTFLGGMPAGLTASIQPAVLESAPGYWRVALHALPSATPGSYSLNFLATGGVTRVLTIPVAVTAQSGKSVAASPIGPVFTVNGENYASPRTFLWAAGSNVTLSASVSQDFGDSRYTFSNWSDGGAATHTFAAPAGNAAYVANFAAQHRLRTQTRPAVGGSVSPSTEAFYPANTPITVTATPHAGYSFSGWEGAMVTGGAQGTLSLTAPVVLTAKFNPISSPSPSWTLSGKAGPLPARMWNFTVTNTGIGGIYDLELYQFTLTQTSGPACAPVVQSKLPQYVGNLAPGGSVAMMVLLDMTGCSSTSAFQLYGLFYANGRTGMVGLGYSSPQTP